nr:germination protein YpeB [Paenibacillus sp. HB172176]
MYRRLSSIMFPITAILLIGAMYWGYQEHQEKNEVLIKAENNYQRAFHNLTFHVEKLHEQLGNTLAVNSTSMAYHRKGLVNVWRLTSEAQNEISQLPLTYLPFGDTENFLSHISNFAYKTSVRDLSKQPLSQDEFKTLKELYDKSDDIAKDLHQMQEDVMTHQMRWMDVEMAIAADQQEGQNPFVDGLRSLDGKVKAYPELNWGPSVSSMYEKRSITMLSGDNVEPADIKKKAAQMTNVDPSLVAVTENGKGTEYSSYSAVVNAEEPDRRIQLDFAKKGGNLLWMMKSRPIGKQTVDFEKAKAASDAFLEKNGFKDMQAVNYDQFDNSGTFTYVGKQNGVLIYPDKLKVKVALDNGEPVGIQAGDYVYEHYKRKLPSPIMTKEEAAKAINPNMKVKKVQLALIDSETGNEALCYEFTGAINNSDYRIYINAETGIEESIETINPADEKASQ